ncbi:MAG: hypothetical protein EZS28_018359 [Streblomastix strix]|uniref:Uncharacterized protein n=1 Tax=Streblomastix strix TaxID=222440 RepID=A0A5J4VV20_9EUKA|nr:MAG: hypothetical protein EZS28_018359 [Streblomastix strix]
MIQGGEGDFVIIWRLNDVFLSGCVTSLDTSDQNERCGVIHLQSEGLKMLISKIVIERYEKTLYNETSKYGLIYVESLNKGDNQGISPVHIEISGIFVIGCHCAVGSRISITNLLMELTDSVFIEPSCYSNMIYLNRTLGTIEDCIFSGRNGIYQDLNLLNEFEQVEEEGKDMCPNNAYYYSSR